MFDYDIKRFKEAGLSDAFWNNSLVTKLNTSVASSPYFNVFLMAQIKMGNKGFLSEQINDRPNKTT